MITGESGGGDLADQDLAEEDLAEEDLAEEDLGDQDDGPITEPALTRLLSLVTTLCDAYPTGLTRAEILERIPEYREGSAEPSALLQRFNRDKQVLRTLGLPLRRAPRRVADPSALGAGGETSALSGDSKDLGGSEAFGEHDYRYVVDPADFAAREVRLAPEEVLALQRAVELWSGTGLHDVAAAALEGIAGLYERRGERLELLDPRQRSTPVSAYRIGDEREFGHLARIAETQHGRPITFDYAKQGAGAPETRRGLMLGCARRGRWYLVIHDLDRGEARTYRLDRILGRGIRSIPEGRLGADERELVRAVEQGEHELSRFDVEAHLAGGPDPEPVRTVVELTQSAAEPLRPLAEHQEPAGDGLVRLTLFRPPEDGLIADLAAAAHELVRLEGEEVRRRLGEHLRAVASAAEQIPELPRLLPVRRSTPGEEAKTSALRRLLDIVAHLHSTSGATRQELCSRFGRTPEQLHADLWHLQVSASWTGGQDAYIELDPFIPHDLDEYLETIGPETVISVEVPVGRADVREELITRPLLLTKPSALAVRVALDGLIASAGHYDRVLAEAAGSLREKLRAMLPESLRLPDSVRAVDWDGVEWNGIDRYGHRGQILAAVRGGHALQIAYRPAAGETGERVVEPVELIYSEDAAYLRAWCRRRRAERQFRLDRITALQALPDDPVGEQARRLAAEPSGPPEVPADEQDLQTVLHFAPPAAGQADRYGPVRHAEHPDGSRTVQTPMRSSAMVVELCLRSGGDVAVVSPETLRAETVRRARTGLDALDGALSEQLPADV